MSTELQSEGHRALLDIVDRLRLTGVTRYIDLPQIVVCGDQSAGKSSVLEAISGIRFPTKDSLCTRFATELVLRREESVALRVCIIPGPDRDEQECQRLSAFTHELEVTNLELSDTIEKAKEAMGLSDTKMFSSDVLRVELQGPDQPHLTLVDLPGLFRAGNREQSAEEAPIVHQLVRGYMEKPRSIILAVISAKSDFALQEVTKYSRELDPKGSRTLGLITKPDTLSKESESEASYVAMAQNKDVVLQLGWHVLKNRSFETRDVPATVRDMQEAQFFRSGVWASLNPSTVGIKSLKPRLSNILRDQILQNLPSLQHDVVTEISNCEARLTQLGQPRSNPQEHRRYLQHVSWKFSILLRAAIEGVYNDSFFGPASTKEGQSKRLRAVVQNSLEDFAEDVRTKGHTQLILDDGEEYGGEDGEIKQISRSAYVASVRDLMRCSRGTELPGTFNPAIIGELFQAQCQPWRELVTQVCHTVLRGVRWTVEAILREVAVEDTVTVLSAHINRGINSLERDLEIKVNEVLQPYLAGHPITYNHYLISNVQKIQANRRRQRIRNALQTEFDGRFSRTTFGAGDIDMLVDMVDEEEEVDMGYYASQLATDYMQAYYQVAMKNCVDDISIHAIEEQLLQKILGVFDPETVDGLSDDDITRMAAEKPTAASDRSHNLEKVETLRTALQELEYLDKSRLHMHIERDQSYQNAAVAQATQEFADTTGAQVRPNSQAIDGSAVLSSGGSVDGPVDHAEAPATEPAPSPLETEPSE